MNEWKQIQLRDISSDISYGYTESATSENIGPKFLRITDITNGRINWETVPYCKISDKDLKKYQLGVGDIVIARTGATTGYNAIIKKEVNAVYASYLIRFQIEKKLADPFFVGHILQSNSFQDYVDAIAGGSAQPGANAQQLADFEFLLPPLPEQKSIAEILSSLDDKIDLLHRQNKTLEQLAETLFRNENEKWKTKSEKLVPFGELVKPKRGKNITKENAIEGEYPVVAGGLEPSCYHNESNTSEPVITVSSSGANAGFVRMYHTPVWASDCSYIDISVTPYLFFSYVFLKINQHILFDKQEGSAQPHVYPSHIMELEISDFSENVIAKFDEQVSPLFQKINSNTKQIQTLTNLRDTLLPKLMSGEVSLEN